ncbi:MAG: AI-2E family transporter [Clostridia bacterium]|nr:AI-2E family transporter [Clostridia bacterium]
MNINGLRRTAYITVIIFGALLGIYLLFKYAFAAVLPFFIAAVIAFWVDKPAARLSEKTGISPRALRLLLTLLATLLTLSAVALAVWGIAARLIDILQNGGLDKIGEMISKITDGVGGILGRIGEGVGDAVLALLSSVAESLGSFVSVFVGGIPRALLFLLVTVISSVYLSLDLDKISGFFRGFLPARVSAVCAKIKASFLLTLVKYLRSYLCLMLLTFGIMLVGLVLLGRSEAFILAAVIALLDILPVIGAGAVLLPWALYSFATGGVGLGVGLVLLYVVQTVIRQLSEPKILGKSLGVHPIITLFLLYVGYTLFGIFGVILVPIFTVLIEVTLNKGDTADVNEPPVAK